ncbi:MAG: hypothetical protein AAF957_12545, partial [Planctomycetota bacterium]
MQPTDRTPFRRLAFTSTLALLLAACTGGGGGGGAPAAGGGGGGGGGGGSSSSLRYHVYFEDTGGGTIEAPRLVDPNDPQNPIVVPGFDALETATAPIVVGTVNPALGRLDDAFIEKL